MTLECAGNNRNFLEPKVKGVQWGLGAVGNAEWTGVPLSILLDRAGVKPNAREVILEGADRRKARRSKESDRRIEFRAQHSDRESAKGRVARLQNERCRSSDRNTVFQCARLFPVGTRWRRSNGCSASSSRTEPFNGYYQTLDYAFWKRRGDMPSWFRFPRCKSKRRSRGRRRRNGSGEFKSARSRRGLDRRWRDYKSGTEHGWRDRLGTKRNLLGEVEAERVAALGI